MIPDRAIKDAKPRSSERFPIKRGVEFRILNRSDEYRGTGKTINISRSGVLFSTEQLLLSPGSRLELTVDWPAQLNSKCAVRLRVRGHVVRSEPGIAAIKIQQYEFRTAAMQTYP